jgi:hypothetical protein
VANNIETQLTEMAKHHQDGLNIRSLLSCIATTLARQSVGFRLDVLDGPLGRTAESGQGMLEMLLLDFLGATITGQEVNLKYAVFNSLTSAMMSEVIHAVQADMPSMTPQAKEDKLKGGRNLPPHSKPESQRLGSSQKRYHEKQHQKAILASYGHLPAANDAYFKEPVKEFMSDMRHDVRLDFDAETGHLIFDPLENHLHSSHVRVSASSSGMHSKTTTGQHQQAREHHARARAVPSKSGDSFGGSGLGLFSRPVSSRKPSGFMDYVDGVLVARDSTIGMFKQVVSHPLDTVSAPFVGAWHVAHHPKLSYQHAVQSTKDFTEHFANASGAERLSISLGFVGSGIYGSAFGAGAYGVGANVLSKVKYGSNLYHTVTSSSMGQGVLRGIDPLRLNPSSRYGRAMYLADNAETTLSELAHHNVIGSHTIRYKANFSFNKVLDLTNPRVAKKWRYEGGYISLHSKAIGKLANQKGYSAIRFWSERDSGSNIALLNSFEQQISPQMISPSFK